MNAIIAYKSVYDTPYKGFFGVYYNDVGPFDMSISETP